MDKFEFTPVQGFLDGTHYPNPTSENDIRAQLQRPLNQIRDFINTMIDNVTSLINTKVDSVEGKGLSTNDYTNEEKTKLASIENGAQVNPTTLKNPCSLIITELDEVKVEYDGSTQKVVEISSKALTPTSYNSVNGELTIGSDASLKELFTYMNKAHVVNALGFQPVAKDYVDTKIEIVLTAEYSKTSEVRKMLVNLKQEIIDEINEILEGEY